MKDKKTIFDIIGSVTSRIEPFHSTTLAWFLAQDKEFLSAFLKKFVPEKFRQENGILSETQPLEVEPEKRFKDGCRLDVFLEFEKAVVGIEVKTVDASTTAGQLEKYWGFIKDECSCKSAHLVYLTPFNSKSPNIDEDIKLHAVDEFKGFSGSGTHINWEEVVDIYKNSTTSALHPYFEAHKNYVRRVICDRDRLNKMQDSRGLADFFGDDAVAQFFTELKERNIVFKEDTNDWVIPIAYNQDKVDDVIACLEVLIESEEVRKLPNNRQNDVPKGVLNRFAKNPFYKLLLDFFEPVPHLWLKGTDKIGVRVAHSNHSGGVSVCTLTTEDIRIRRNR